MSEVLCIPKQREKLGIAAKYAFFVIPLLLWWGIVFFPFNSQTDTLSQSKAIAVPPPSLTNLSEWTRQELHQALLGDCDQIIQLISNWHIDAALLKEKKKGVKTLSDEQYVQAHALYRAIKKKTAASNTSFLPQTYQSAAILLALIDDARIVALPKGFIKRETLFPEEMVQGISLEVDRNHSEALFLKQPKYAFVAPYSLPSTLAALKNQGIQLCYLPSPTGILEISQAILQIGSTVEELEKSALLALFLESALNAIDNKILTEKKEGAFSFLYTSFSTTFHTPTKRALVWSLLDRTKAYQLTPLTLKKGDPSSWSLPVTQEQFHLLDPEILLVTTSEPESCLQHIYSTSQMKKLLCRKKRAIFPLDSDLQYSPTQFMALAYYDIAEALIQGSWQ